IAAGQGGEGAGCSATGGGLGCLDSDRREAGMRSDDAFDVRDRGVRAPKPDGIGDDSRFRRLGLLIVAVVFGGLGTWAALAPLDSAAVGRGVITVENYRKTVQHLDGGIVRALHVRDGDYVKRDEVL